MIKIKKVIPCLFAMMLLLSNFAYAEKSSIIPQYDGTTDIRLDMLKVTVPYNASDIEVKFVKDSTFVKAIILDKETKKELDTYTEFIEPPKNAKFGFNMSTRNDGDIIYRTLTRKKDVTPASVEACARVEIYSSGSFRQINKVEEVWQRPGNSGSYTLEDKKTFCNTSLPSSRITVNVSGNVVVKSTTTIGGEFSFEFLESCGFSMSGSSSGDWYARKGYNMDILISLY